MTVVIVQCRLSSVRLPRKALKDLGGQPVLAWTLRAMHKVVADAYYVATDEDSLGEIESIALSCKFKCFAGPCDDVLERFCMLIKKIKADVVVRATADNPFLFYEAAQSLLDEYMTNRKKEQCDYITWTGLPHGSGVEVFNAHSLLKAKELTSDPYDHEHVCPSIYNHPENFKAAMIPSPKRWSYPRYRTTIDTEADYIRALHIVQTVSCGKASNEPYTTEQILSSFDNSAVCYPILCVPSTKKGRGTGHLRRCLDIAKDTGASVYISKDADLEEIDDIVGQYIKSGLRKWQITSAFPSHGEYRLIFTDMFSLEEEFAKKLHDIAPVVSIDEGSHNTSYSDYTLNIIPSSKNNDTVNMTDPCFMDMPIHKRTEEQARIASDLKKVLICIGGEDPADLVIPAAIALAQLGKKVVAIHPAAEKRKSRIPADLKNLVQLEMPVHDLREKLSEYDLVVTHYGLTAYEAAAAGCAVLLLGTTPLHIKLAASNGFKYLRGKITATSMAAALKKPKKLYRAAVPHDSQVHIALGEFVRMLSYGRRFPCPVCNTEHEVPDEVVSRTHKRTFRRCRSCGILYMSWTVEEMDGAYNKSYFFEQYKEQYGKTYLDDFSSIKAQCVRRITQIDLLYHKRQRAVMTPAILDIGCAFGPFLVAASDSGWHVFGVDVSQEAVSYVRSKLLLPAVCSSFPNFDSMKEFGIRNFDAVVMWYVIEHFKNLDAVLKTVSSIVKFGGIFAFSTPSVSGVSGLFNRKNFFEQSPFDHYTLWEPSRTQSILSKYGFKVIRIITTGHHPERFPLIRTHDWQKKSLPFMVANAASHTFHLGDTFEVYCKKITK